MKLSREELFRKVQAKGKNDRKDKVKGKLKWKATGGTEAKFINERRANEVILLACTKLSNQVKMEAMWEEQYFIYDKK
jgi:hypothetical protein